MFLWQVPPPVTTPPPYIHGGFGKKVWEARSVLGYLDGRIHPGGGPLHTQQHFTRKTPSVPKAQKKNSLATAPLPSGEQMAVWGQGLSIPPKDLSQKTLGLAGVAAFAGAAVHSGA